MAARLTRTMNFSDEQGMLLDTAVGFFRDKSPIASVRENIRSPEGFAAGVWSEMTELGWLGLAVPEAFGGSGLGLAEAVTIAEPMGRHLFAGPFQSSQLAVQALLQCGHESLQAEWLPRLAAGEVATVALAEPTGDWSLTSIDAKASAAGGGVVLSGTKTLVVDAALAELVIASVSVGGAPGFAFISRDQLSSGALTREVVIDETRRSYRLDLGGIQVSDEHLIRGENALAMLRAIEHGALLLISAESCGGIAGALDTVVDYLNTRTQFGRVIGGYQALKHPTVDILVGLERARSHLYHAASVVGSGQADIALRMAKAEAAEAFAFAGDRAIQFHGGFGFTYECDAQLYLRRALWCQYQFGDAAHHRKSLAGALLD